MGRFYLDVHRVTYFKLSLERPHRWVTFRLQLTSLYGLGQVNSSFIAEELIAQSVEVDLESRSLHEQSTTTS